MKTVFLYSLALVCIVTFSDDAFAAAKKSRSSKRKPVAIEAEEDWSARAGKELEAAKLEVPASRQSRTEPTSPLIPQAATAATIEAEVEGTRSIIERTALRFTFLFEPYQPKGTATLASGQEITYSELPPSVLGQVDARWLPFSIGEVATRPLSAGGYVAGGYSRQTVPLVAPSGFRYDDVALNTLRLEAGLATGITLGEKWNLEGRLGAGRSSVVQTSRFSDVVGSFQRAYVVGALDLSYHLNPRFAFVASIARRSPIGDGSGALEFDPLTVAGGFLVQVR